MAQRRLSLEQMHTELGWPNPSDVLSPKGPGAAVYANTIRQKLQRALQNFPEAASARVGVLMSDPSAATSEPPLAIVAEFEKVISSEVLRELHRFCWNFSHAPTVITLEPALIRVWSCCEAPDPSRDISDYMVEQIDARQSTVASSEELQSRAARSLHWVNLVSGKFFSERAARFNRDGRADQMLLSNLRYMREALNGSGLSNDDICHDLLARVIFVQFLFDRKDQDGRPALSASKLKRLHDDGILEVRHDTFHSILSSYDETYRLFDWLNSKFNGDLFPGKGATAEEREVGWRSEKAVVKPEHLALLSEFIKGELDMPAQQICLWPQYAFDVIPLEFISSIYETFVTERAAGDGIFYTPPHLVDFILDRILPWGGKEWDLKVIDPACGSGIFLVKAFQRLVHRWKNANPDEPVRADTLRRLMTRNIFGVDKDPHAVRVACFSLYLAMCDEIEPRHYWSKVTFPSMRGRRLICSDFFNEDTAGFQTDESAGQYDLVIGNAPWGAGVISDPAIKWAAEQSPAWAISNEDIGGLFLAKGAKLVSSKGRVALIQSANALLFNIGSTAKRFRKSLFSEFSVETIYNLSALRFTVFSGKAHTTKKSVSPVCVVVLNNSKPSPSQLIEYICPKHVRPLVDEFTIMIEPLDHNVLETEQAATDSLIWSELMWGRSRDLQLIKRLQAFPSLNNLPNDYKVAAQRGIVFGDRKKVASYFDGRRLFDEKDFPDTDDFSLPVENLPVVEDLLVDLRASSKLEAYQWPQLLVKLSLKRNSGRFHARLNKSKKVGGVLCNQSYLTIHGDREVLEAACIAHNSLVAVYYQFLTSGRVAAYRPKLSRDDIMSLPIPHPVEGLLENVTGYYDLDKIAFQQFKLNDAERVLIEDAIEYTFEDFLGNEHSPGRRSTMSDPEDSHLKDYSEYLIKVMQAGFGQDKSVKATVFAPKDDQVPFRLVSFQLIQSKKSEIAVESLSSIQLIDSLSKLETNFKEKGGNLFHQRVVRIYDVVNEVPTIFIIKPDEKRFWTRSIALDDGDKVALDLFQWQQNGSRNKKSAIN